MAIVAQSVGFGINPQPGVIASPGSFQTSYDFISKYAPEKAAELFQPFEHGTLMGILDAMGATEEYGKGSDTHFWAEAGQLMPVAKAGVGSYSSVTIASISGDSANLVGVGAKLPFQKGDILQVVATDGTSGLDRVIVAATAPALTLAVRTYDKGAYGLTNGTEVVVTKIGNEQLKGSDPLSGAIGLETITRSNQFKISRGYHEQGLSDVPNKTWFSANGNFYWTTQEIDAARQRFTITRDFDLLTSEKTHADSGAYADGYRGMEGIFSAIRARGNNWKGDFALSGTTDIETVIKRLEVAGAPKSNMLLTNTAFSLALDKAFASLNNVGVNGTPTSTVGRGNYGSFVNKPDNLINLGFKGVEWGGYSFYKKTLEAFTNPTSPFHDTVNNYSTVKAIMIPVGQTAVAPDMELGKRNVPYITVMYKGGNGEDRRLKTTMRDFQTDGKDKMQVDFLSEYSTRVACANKFMLFEA